MWLGNNINKSVETEQLLVWYIIAIVTTNNSWIVREGSYITSASFFPYTYCNPQPGTLKSHLWPLYCWFNTWTERRHLITKHFNFCIYILSFKKRSEDPTEEIKRLVLRCIYFVKLKFSHHQQLVKIIELQKIMNVFSVLKW